MEGRRIEAGQAGLMRVPALHARRRPLRSAKAKPGKGKQYLPTYAATGARIRDYSLDALMRLARQRRVYFSYGSGGRLLSATFLPHDESRVLRQPHKGQKYSFQERVAGDYRAWRHAPMFSLRDADGQPLDVVETELFIRSVFRAVPLSILRPDPPPAKNNKVVSIETGRRAA